MTSPLYNPRYKTPLKLCPDCMTMLWMRNPLTPSAKEYIYPTNSNKKETKNGFTWSKLQLAGWNVLKTEKKGKVELVLKSCWGVWVNKGKGSTVLRKLLIHYWKKLICSCNELSFASPFPGVGTSFCYSLFAHLPYNKLTKKVSLQSLARYKKIAKWPCV